MVNFQMTFLTLIWCVMVPIGLEAIPCGWQSSINLTTNGFEFSPSDYQSLFVMETSAISTLNCARICHSNTLCRVFDYDSQSYRCRLFEGDIVTMGSIVDSSSAYSRVGSIRLYSELFADRGQSCSLCEGSKYLTRINDTCQCQLHTYFDGAICRSQKLFASECNQSIECRTDLNYSCLPRMQCGPLSVQIGTTVAGYGNGTAGNALNALHNPYGLVLNSNASIYVADFSNNRVIKLQEGSLFGSIVAGTGVSGSGATQLNGPSGIYVDALLNLYISDSGNFRMMLWPKNSSSGVRVAGSGTNGNTLNSFNAVDSIITDSQGNLYISDPWNQRVMKWIPYASSGTIIAGTGVMGNNSQQLNMPYGLYLDEATSSLYVTDTGNHRIQRFFLNNTMNASTVAGGNGAGARSDQLNTPSGVYVSNKTGAIYICDYNNNRIQRWNVGATSGVTIAGINGSNGTNPMLLSRPVKVVLNSDETYVYVSDQGNHRVQRFELF